MGAGEADDPAGQTRRRPRTVDVREVLNAIFYLLSTGRQWPALPKDLPPKSMVWDDFSLWEWDRPIERIHHALSVAERERAGREASATTATIDGQTAKAAQKGGVYAGPVWLRCRPEDPRAQAPRPDRHARTVAGRGDPSGGCAGSRRRRAAVATGAPAVCLPSNG